MTILDGKVYTNQFADIAPMTLATTTNTVLNIINVDKTSAKIYLTKITPELGQNQQIPYAIFFHRKADHYKVR